MEKGREKRIISILMTLTIIFTLMGGTLSYLRWQTSVAQRTNVVFTVNQNFSCAADGGGDIASATLAPASCTNTKYAIQRTVTVTPKIQTDGLSIGMNLWLDINELGSGLSQSEYFRYALTTVENDCMSGVVTHGTFTGLSSENNDRVILLDEERYTSSEPQTYYLYIWIDPREENNYIVDQSFNFSLGGSCNEVIKGEPFYAVYSEDDTSLRFYKEEDGAIVEGEAYEGRIASKVYKAYETDVYTYDSTTKRTTSPWDEVRDNVTKIVIEDEISPVSTASWFDRFINTSSIDVTKLNTSNVKSMYRMFTYAGNDVTDSFTITGLNNWNVSNVVDMYAMFSSTGHNAKEWNIGNLSNWNVSSVINMQSMFNAAGYTAIQWHIENLSNWNVSNVIDMYAMFASAGRSATDWDVGNLSSWDVSNVTNMKSMFNNAGYSAGTFNIGNLNNWDVSNVVNMNSMFKYAGYSTGTFNIGNLDNWNVSKVTNIGSMFNFAGYTATTFNIGNLSKWDVSNVTDMSYVFTYASYNATTFDIGNLNNWDTSKVTNMIAMFNSCGYSATTYNIGNLSNWDTSKVTNMSWMFQRAGYNDSTFSIGDLSNWNVSNVKYMRSMFNHAGENSTTFAIGDISNWDVSSVIDMTSMFQSAGYSNASFSIGNISKWNTSNVISMAGMFSNTGYSATDWSLNLSGWDVDKVIYYGGFNTNVSDKITAPTWVNEDQGTPPDEL